MLLLLLSISRCIYSGVPGTIINAVKINKYLTPPANRSFSFLRSYKGWTRVRVSDYWNVLFRLFTIHQRERRNIIIPFSDTATTGTAGRPRQPLILSGNTAFRRYDNPLSGFPNQWSAQHRRSGGFVLGGPWPLRFVLIFIPLNFFTHKQK